MNYLNILKTNNYSEHTIINYKSELIHFFAYMEKKQLDVSTINIKVIRKYLSELMQKGYAVGTIRTKVSRVNTYFKYLKDIGQIEVNPFFSLKLPKREKKVPTIIVKSQIEKLVENQVENGDTFRDVRDTLIIQTLLQTGMRRAEIVNLKISDIRFDEGEILIHGKGRKQRIVPIGNKLVNLYKAYFELRNNLFFDNIPSVFLSIRGKQVSESLIYKIVTDTLENTEMSKKSPHGLRHAFATILSENGANILDIQKLMGHEDANVTKIYTHTSINRLKSAYKRAHPLNKKKK